MIHPYETASCKVSIFPTHILTHCNILCNCTSFTVGPLLPSPVSEPIRSTQRLHVIQFSYEQIAIGIPQNYSTCHRNKLYCWHPLKWQSLKMAFENDNFSPWHSPNDILTHDNFMWTTYVRMATSPMPLSSMPFQCYSAEWVPFSFQWHFS